MTERNKDKIFGVAASMVTSIIVVFISFTLNSNRTDAKELDQRLNAKVDKIEFKEHQEANNKRFESVESRQEKTIEQLNATLQEIAKQNATMQNDIVWIKQTLKNN